MNKPASVTAVPANTRNLQGEHQTEKRGKAVIKDPCGSGHFTISCWQPAWSVAEKISYY